nr:hypothetical protein [Tanacetum cinerariifolium]
MNADELPEIDPYEEPEHPEYHASSDDDIQVEDDEEDPEEDPSEEHEPKDDDEDPEEDPNEEHEREDTKEPSKGRRAAMIRMRYDILEEDMPPQRRFVLTAPLPGYDVAKSFVVAAARAPRSQYNFVDAVKVGQGLVCSPGHDTWTIVRAADRAEDVGYVRSLQASERRMMTSIKEVNLKVSYQAQAYLRSEARNRALLARLKTLETHTSHMEWQRQSAEDLAVTHMMRIHALEARARTDKVEDVDSSC